MELTGVQQIYLDMVVVAFLAFMVGMAYASWTACARPSERRLQASGSSSAKAAAKA